MGGRPGVYKGCGLDRTNVTWKDSMSSNARRVCNVHISLLLPFLDCSCPELALDASIYVCIADGMALQLSEPRTLGSVAPNSISPQDS
jgi:hypothetical protein